MKHLVLHCIGGDAASCAKGASLYEAGIGDRTYKKRARFLARLACAHGQVASCKTLSGRHGDPFPEKLGRLGLAKACAGGAYRVCHHLAVRLAAGTGGLQKQPKRAHKLQVKACRGGIGDACYAVAIAFGYGNEAVEIDTKEYLEHLILSCKLRSAAGCRELRTPNAQLRRACREQGLAAACALLKTRR